MFWHCRAQMQALCRQSELMPVPFALGEGLRLPLFKIFCTPEVLPQQCRYIYRAAVAARVWDHDERHTCLRITGNTGASA